MTVHVNHTGFILHNICTNCRQIWNLISPHNLFNLPIARAQVYVIWYICIRNYVCTFLLQVAVLEHVIAVCRHLREKGDFLSLKYLLSAVRASVSQRHQTHVSWKVTVQGMAWKAMHRSLQPCILQIKF